MKENEYILYRNSLKGASKDMYSPLTDLYKQKNNRKVLGGLPYVNFYNFGKLFYDTVKINRKKQKVLNKYHSKLKSATSKSEENRILSKKEKKIAKINRTLTEGTSFMRSFGEPPVIVDTAKIKATQESMKAYLFSKGYFHNKVITDIDTLSRKKRIVVKYICEQGNPYIIREVRYEIEDAHVDSLLNIKSVFQKSIKANDYYDEDVLNNEREKIYRILKDYGYFDFQRQYIDYEIDTLGTPYSLSIKLSIHKQHDIYRLSKLYFNLNDYNPSPKAIRDTFLYKNVHYTYLKKTYLRKLLDYKITIRPYDIYNQSKFQQTQRLLGAMDLYKFVNINVVKNEQDTVSKTLTAFINTEPISKYQISQEYGLSVGQALVPGPFLSLTLKTRNLFRWLDVIENTFRYSLETQYSIVSPDQPYRTSEFSAYTSISLPQLLIPTKLRDVAKKYNPRVKFFTGYTYVNRPEYRRESFNGGLTYSFTRNIYSSIFITPINVSFIGSKVDPLFDLFLRDLKTNTGSNLFLSFNPSIVTNFQVYYVYNNYDVNSKKTTKYFRPSVEFGGIVPNIVANNFGSENDRKNNLLFNKQYFQYVRAGLDFRLYVPVKKKNMFVIRYNLGYAQPYGGSNSDALYALPYEKYFFSGGNSSIRAWRPRRLGPGSYSQNADDSYRFEQPGEILFETNYEYRFNMISIFDGALFVDAGNVWNIKNEKTGAQFSLPKAFGEIAVGAGVGLRLDFSFLILRLDLANKIVDPAMPEGERFVGKFTLRGTTANIGIGYPF